MVPWRSGALLVVIAASLAEAAAGENWPGWRGPRGDSTSLERGLPVAWNATRGVAWRAALPAWGASTPAVWGEAVYLTAQEGTSLVVMRLDRRSGRVVWTRQVGESEITRGNPARGNQVFHPLQNLASPSPVTDGERVVVHFGNGELAALDPEGKVLWQRNLQRDFGPYTIWWGHANSPVLFENLVISTCLHDSLADERQPPVESYLVAHEVLTGRVAWKTARRTDARAEQCDAYTTPVLAEVEGEQQLVVMGANQLDAYDPATGQQAWYLPGLSGGRTVTGPTVSESLVYVTQGMRGPLLAVKLGGSGRKPASDVAWKFDQGTPDSVSPVVANELVFLVTDHGVARALDARTGHVRWTQRLKGDYKATPLVAEGRVYVLNTSGLCTVLAASARFEKLAENQLPETTLASPAASGGNLFVRGHEALYCLGEQRLGGP